MHLNEWTRRAESRADLYFCVQTLCSSTFGISIPMLTIAQRPRPPPAASDCAGGALTGASQQQSPQAQLTSETTRPDGTSRAPAFVQFSFVYYY